MTIIGTSLTLGDVRRYKAFLKKLDKELDRVERMRASGIKDIPDIFRNGKLIESGKKRNKSTKRRQKVE